MTWAWAWGWVYIDLCMYQPSSLRVYVRVVTQIQSLYCGSESVWYRSFHCAKICSVLYRKTWMRGANEFKMHDTEKKSDPTHPEVSMGKPELELGSTEIVNKKEERAYGTSPSHSISPPNPLYLFNPRHSAQTRLLPPPLPLYHVLLQRRRPQQPRQRENRRHG